MDEDDLQTEQVFQRSDIDPPPGAQRNEDGEGNEKVQGVYTTRTGLVFQNDLLFTLEP